MELAASDCTVRFALLQFAPSVDLQYVLCYTCTCIQNEIEPRRRKAHCPTSARSPLS